MKPAVTPQGEFDFAGAPPRSDTELPTGITAETLFPGQAGATIDGAFRRMEIAEEIIADAKEEHPLLAGRIHRAFTLLCPTPLLQNLTDDLYRHHAGELVRRVATGDDTTLATDAEILAALANATLEIAPDRTARLLYVKLFTDVFPDAGEKIHGDELSRVTEYEHGEIADLRAYFQRKLETPTRHL